MSGASKELKEAGVPGGVRQAARMCGRPESTVYEWHKNHRALFEVIKNGCAMMIKTKNDP